MKKTKAKTRGQLERRQTKPVHPTSKPTELSWAELTAQQQDRVLRLIGAAGLGKQEFYNVAETSQVAGCSDTTIIRRINEGSISALRHGQIIRIPIAEIARLLSL